MTNHNHRASLKEASPQTNSVRMKRKEKADGFSEGFEPVRPLDPRKIRTVDDLVQAMGKTSFTARRIGEAADLFYEMVSDPDCKIVLTLSGAMTVAKMGLQICEMIERGMVHAVVSTGALISHGLVESKGLTHFKCPPRYNDVELFEKGYNRVYDTLELEANLDNVETFLAHVLADHDPAVALSSSSICKKIGKKIGQEYPQARGILKTAEAKKVPVFIPAFTDCELGLDFALLNRKRKMKNLEPFSFDAFEDLELYAEFIKAQPKRGIFTIGGGVPRTWAQQASCYLDLIQTRLFGKDNSFYPFLYGIRICPDPPHFGHMSGCTYSEGVSWGKFVPQDRGGRWVEVLTDATVAWPLILQAVIERIDNKKI